MMVFLKKKKIFFKESADVKKHGQITLHALAYYYVCLFFSIGSVLGNPIPHFLCNLQQLRLPESLQLVIDFLRL